MLIRQYLKDKDLTQRAFANDLGITVAFLNSILNGKNTDIKISLLDKLCKKTKIAESKLIHELLAFKKAEASGASGRRKAKKPKA